MRATDVLTEAISGSAGDVTIPRSTALEIDELLRQRDVVAYTADAMLTPQQRRIFFLMRDHLGVVFPSGDIQEAASIETTAALYVALWRLGKALEQYLPQYRLRSVIGQGWMLEEQK